MSRLPPDDPRFSRQQMLACVPGLSEEVFKQWIVRSVVAFTDDAPMGKGRRRLYTPADVIQVATLHEMARQGIMVSKAVLVWHLVRGRLIALAHPPLAGELGYAVALAIHPTTGELVSRTFIEGEAPFDPNDDDAPDVMVLFRVDRFIARMRDRMDAILADKPAAPPPNPTRNEEPDFFRRWATDGEARRVLVGLTAEETAEYERTRDADASDYDAKDRYLELHDKHEAARLQRLMIEGRN